MKITVSFEVNHTVAPTLAALAVALSGDDIAECANEVLAGVSWAIQECLGHEMEVSSHGLTSLVQTKIHAEQLIKEVREYRSRADG